jgi:hypothetical protein
MRYCFASSQRPTLSSSALLRDRTQGEFELGDKSRVKRLTDCGAIILVLLIIRLSVPCGDGKRLCGGYEPEVAECLRKVAKQAACVGVDLFGEQPEVRGEGRSSVEYGAGPIDLSGDSQSLCQPEGTEKKCPFLPFESVVALVAVNEPLFIAEVRLDGVDGGAEAHVVGGEESDYGSGERRRVQCG